MTLEQVQKLHPGDKVFWIDPEDDPEHDCSRTYTIQSIEIIGEVVRIEGKDGSVLECFADELS